jgi:gamma-glutamylcyclotransferase (GGCT)/AIG2-like uncharacterized protein YtfP
MASLMFVYGTLRKDARGQMLSPLCRGWIFRGYGTVPGELYDFGAYPGAVPANADSATRVVGEVYELPEPRAMLPPIDRYEGCSEHDPPPHEFERERVEVTMEDGPTLAAWIYWYRPEPLGQRLASGDYLQRTGDRRPDR